MLCYILAQYAPQVHENILLFFRHKKQSHRNCCRILNINLVIGICKSNSSKLQILPTPGQASTNPNPANCRYFRSRPGIYKSNTSKLQMLPNPGYVSTSPISANCGCFRTRPGICKSNSSKLQILPHPEFTPICIYKSNTSKLQMLPNPG